MKVRRLAYLVLVLSSFAVVAPAPIRGQQTPAKDDGSAELPEGDGKRILQASCTACHTLKEVTKFKGHYDLDDWKDIIATMVAYGTKLSEEDSAVLAEYLAKNLGPKPTSEPQ